MGQIDAWRLNWVIGREAEWRRSRWTQSPDRPPPARLRCCVYNRILRKCAFAWDPTKSARNLAKRYFDFAFASLIFDGPTLERIDSRRDYGEERRIAIGMADGILITLVYTDRAYGAGIIRRIISARVSNRHECKAYTEVFPAS